jgi:PleD family two-component response regulator
MIFLIVDDSRPTRNLLKNYVSEITDNPYDDFLEAEDAETALRILQSRPIDFVFLDLNLSTKATGTGPVLTGIDILKEIQKIEKLKQLPIIMVSSDSDKVNVVDAVKYGAKTFVVKPIDKQIFADKVRKVMKSLGLENK